MHFIPVNRVEWDEGTRGLVPRAGKRLLLNTEHIIAMSETDHDNVTRLRCIDQRETLDVFGALDEIHALCFPAAVIVAPPISEEDSRRIRELVRDARGMTSVQSAGMQVVGVAAPPPVTRSTQLASLEEILRRQADERRSLADSLSTTQAAVEARAQARQQDAYVEGLIATHGLPVTPPQPAPVPTPPRERRVEVD